MTRPRSIAEQGELASVRRDLKFQAPRRVPRKVISDYEKRHFLGEHPTTLMHSEERTDE